jgi:NadR type nicotinamide-nucleotide adenylyltransferase
MVAQLARASGGGGARCRVKRIVLTGSESTGKTTLAKRLAEHYDTEWVPEFVRDYVAAKGGPLEFGDHRPIARGQIAREDEYLARAKLRGATLLVQDTDLLSTAVYCAHYYERCPPWIEEAARARRPDLYLLLDIDIPWEPDPQRDRGDQRPEMQALFRGTVERSGAPFVVVCGTGDARFAAAVAAIERLLVNR